MRKIEIQMNDAISNQKNWSNANTQVLTEGNISRVFLHGNQIATIGENFIQLFDGGYQSATTKARLNAILSTHGCEDEYIFQRKGEWFINYNGAPIPFFSGMRLN